MKKFDPRLKKGIVYSQNAPNGPILIGSRNKNFLLPPKISDVDVKEALDAGLKGQSFEVLLSILDELGLIDTRHSQIPYQYRDEQISTQLSSDNKGIAMINYLERIEIESQAITNYPEIGDGGVEELLARKSFPIWIFGDNRISWNLFTGLIATGFDDCKIINIENSLLTATDLMGGFNRKSDIGRKKSDLAREALREASLYPESQIGLSTPKLVISTEIPPPEVMQDWNSKKLPQLHIHTLAPGEARIGPFVKPGETACYNCLLITETEGGFLEPPRDESASIALTQLLTGIAIMEISLLAAGSNSGLKGKSLLFAMANSFAPQITYWERHPRCGCNWI